MSEQVKRQMEHMQHTLRPDELRVPALPDRLAMARDWVRSAARAAGCDEESVANVVLAVNEACMNVIQHGYRFAPDREFLLRVRQEQDALVFELLDHAPPVRPETVQPRPLDEIRPGGLGVHFIRSIMDEMKFETAPDGFGNLLRMVKKIKGSAHGA
jgi:sigma-B regulation protein RsbU (phosphoserine phosphatase)